MDNHITELVNAYDSGRMSRRDLVTHMAALVGTAAGLTALGRTAAAQTTPTFQANGLNHIALRVTNVQRSRDFYLKHLGMTVTRDGATSCFMTCGDHFVALFQGSEPSMDHYCYSVENFEIKDAVAKLEAEGLNPDNPAGSSRVYFKDPDGLTVQLASKDHRA